MALITAAISPRADGGRVVFSPDTADLTLWLAPSASREAARQQARQWLGELVGQPAETLPWVCDDQGKPLLDGIPLSFNLSHGRGWMALAWSRTLPAVGVDLETLGRQQDRARLAARYFHPAEQALAGNEPDWLAIWTRKEAVVKAHGLGLRLTLSSLDTTTSPVQHQALGSWALTTVRLGDIALCSVSWPAG